MAAGQDGGWDQQVWAAPVDLHVGQGEHQTHYRVDTHFTNTLGRGYFGEVYKGVEVTANKRVAVKRIAASPNFDINNIATRTQDLKRLSYPNIVRIYDIQSNRDMIWIMMEFCDERDLVTYMKNNQLDLEERLKVLDDATLGLDYLHTQGVIHRDVNPANIMVHGTSAKLGDFDTSRAIDPNSRLLATTFGLGTPAYYSPELWMEDSQGRVHYNKQTDIFSLALTYLAVLQHAQGDKGMKPRIESYTSKVSKTIGQILAENSKEIMKSEKSGLKIAVAVVLGVAAAALLAGGVVGAIFSNIVIGVLGVGGGSASGVGAIYLALDYKSYKDEPFSTDDTDYSFVARKKREKTRKLIQSMVAFRPSNRPTSGKVRDQLQDITPRSKVKDI